MISKNFFKNSLIVKAAAFSVLAAIVITVLIAGNQTPASQAASSYPFPSRADDLAPGNYWYFADIHAGGSKALDLVGVRFDQAAQKWTRNRKGVALNEPNLENDDLIIYDTPIRAIADGEVVACWRNAPSNPRPGESNPGRLSTPKTIARSGNFLVVKIAGNKTVLYAHMKPGSVPPAFCPFNAQFMQNADDKDGSSYPVESFIPEGNRPTVKAGQVVGHVGNVGAASGPHLHIDMSDILPGDNEGPSLPINFHGAWVKSILKAEDSSSDWVRLNGEELDTPKTAILPDYLANRDEFARHGVTASEFQFTFSRITHSGYRPVWIDGYEVNGTNYFNAIFRPTDGVASVIKWGLNADQYQDEFDLRVGQGYRPLQVESYPDGNSIRYAVIFVKQAGPNWTAYHGRTVGEHQSLFNSLKSQGYVPRNISVVSVGGQLHFTALYDKTPVTGFVAWSTLTPNEYQAQFNANTQVGRQLVYLNAYNHAGGVRFSAIWQAPVAGAYAARHDLSGAQYQNEWEKWTGLGYLTRLVTGYEDDNTAKFAGLWRK